MSPARLHRERFAAQAANVDPSAQMIDPAQEGGQPAPATVLIVGEGLSAAAMHRLRYAAAAAVTLEVAETSEGDPIPPAAVAEAPAPASSAEAQIRARLVHDRRRLSDIKAIDRKVAAKLEMLPEYEPWLQGVLAAAAETGKAAADEIAPTCMVWKIDVGDYAGALALARYVVGFAVPMPAHFNRDGATIAAEMFAEAALARTGDPLAMLPQLLEVEELTAEHDMHDQVRAKLMKAIGVGVTLASEQPDVAADQLPVLRQQALASLLAAEKLDERIGVKGRIAALQKLLPPPPENTAAGIPPPAGNTAPAGNQEA